MASNTMSGLWLENRTLRLRDDLPVPVPADGEALVRVLLAGICNTDLELVRGYYPFTGVPGHEFVGVVEQGPEEWVGARVVGEINLRPAGCRCRACSNGRPTHCERRTVLGIAGRDGAFAGYLVLPVENLHRVPDGVTNEAAVFTEPLAAALEILEQVAVGAGDRVLVVGDGKLGQLIARTLALTGCSLTVAGRHLSKLAPLARLGAATAWPSAIEADPEPWDLAVECTGSPGGFALARDALRPRGTLVMKSTYAGELTVDVSSLVVDEITLVGSRCGPFEPALALLAGGRVEVESLISERLPLAEGVAAFERARAPSVLKVLLEIEPAVRV